MARDICADRLTVLTREAADEIITDYLAPAQQRAVEEFTAAAAKYRRYGASAEEIIKTDAPKAAIDAFRAAGEAAQQFGPIRSALTAARLASGGDVEHDSHRYFATIRNCEIVWPAITQATRPATPPWPTKDAPTFLPWCADNRAELWAPTVSQQDEKWSSVFGQRVKHQRQNAAHMRQFADVFGG